MTTVTRLEPDMPPEAPLEMPGQDFGKRFLDDAAPPRGRVSGFWRWAAFLPALLTTVVLIGLFTDAFSMDGLSLTEGALITLIAFSFFWIAFTVSTATVGLIRARVTPEPAPDLAPMDVALLVPIYNEVPENVLGNAWAMADSLSRAETAHQYALYILSDTRDPEIAAEEFRAFTALKSRLTCGTRVYFRRRPMNTDRKVGNLSDWIRRWGGAHEAMLVLDADSLMSGEAIIALTDVLSRDPSAGLIQSATRIIGATTLFGRLQQFSSLIYGAALARGLAAWTGREGNYWGHNAIIRTRAFAACAGLKRLPSWRGDGKLILSHDFVEAGLLRRAGWSVRLEPAIVGSYEEVPPTLVDYSRRDRRWCQGNLQHLWLLGAKGFHPVSRFHLFQGAMSYLMSPIWMILLTIWALVGTGGGESVITYFSGLSPRPHWPEMSDSRHFAVLLFMYGMLLAPKAFGLLAFWRFGLRLSDIGGPIRAIASALTEIILSIVYAPILMVQQTVAVIRTGLGISEGWVPQRTGRGHYGWWMLLRFHGLETVAGVSLAMGIGSGLVTLWLLPIAISLSLAVPLSALSGFRLTSRLLGTEDVFNPPSIVSDAKNRRSRIRTALESDAVLAAE